MKVILMSQHYKPNDFNSLLHFVKNASHYMEKYGTSRPTKSGQAYAIFPDEDAAARAAQPTQSDKDFRRELFRELNRWFDERSSSSERKPDDGGKPQKRNSFNKRNFNKTNNRWRNRSRGREEKSEESEGDEKNKNKIKDEKSVEKKQDTKVSSKQEN